MELRDVLKKLRNELGLSQTELASILHINYATVSRWELGKTRPNRALAASLLDYARSRSVSRECIKGLETALLAAAKKRLESSDPISPIDHNPLSRLIEEATFPVFVCDIKTDELLYLNKKAEELLGGRLDELPDRKCYKCLMNRDTVCPFCQKEELSEERFTAFNIFKEDESVFHHVQAKLIKWNGRDAQVRYITDNSGNTSREAEREREAFYYEQLKIRKELAANAIASAHYNLTHNTVSDIVCKNEKFVDILSIYSIDKILSSLRKTAFSEEDLRKLDAVPDRKGMIKQFYAGKTHLSVKHYIKSLSGYFKGTFDLMQNPVTYDIEAFAALHDVTESAMAEEIVSKLVRTQYETVATINAETGEAHNYIGIHLSDVIEEQQSLGDNKLGVEAYMRKYCINDDVESIIKETSLPYVKEQLKIKPLFSVAYSLRINGVTIHKKANFTYLDNNHTTILCAMQNITELYQTELAKRDQIAAALQTLQEQAGMNVARYDLKTQTFYSNCEMATVQGYGNVIENVPEEFIEKGLVAAESADEYRAFYEKLRNGKSGTITAACRVADGSFHWLRVDGKVIFDRDDKPSQAIISFKDIEEEREQAAVYKNWLHSLSRKNPSDYTLFRCNLTKGSSFDKREGELLKTPFSEKTCSFNERTREYAGRYVHLNDFDEYSALLNSENLLAGYYRGIRKASLDYRENIGDEKYRRLRVTVEMAQYPDSSDVEAFLMYEEVSPECKESERDDEGLDSSVFENTDAVLVKYDIKTGDFTYDSAMERHLLGKYDSRPIWQIFLADGVADTQDIKTFKKLIRELAETEGRSCASMELTLKIPSGENHWFAFYAIKQTQRKSASGSIIITILDINNDVLVNKTLRFRAAHDSLTGLYNRSAFLKLVSETVSGRPADSYILFCSDINDFRFINERFGREAGDRLLVFSAEKLKIFAEDYDGFAGRLSGDIFAILLPNTEGIFDRASEKIQNYFKGYPLATKVTGRTGAYIISDPSMKADTMLDMAITAKESIRGKYAAWLALYDEGMNEKRLREKSISDRMETALAEGQFDVYIQPQFHHATGQIVGAEALVRWIDPERGIISPGEFIPVFEKNGFITKMDEYVWEKAAQYVSVWMSKGYDPVPLSVNVSREDTNDPELCQKLMNIVEKYNIPVHIFRLEITESLFAEDTKRLVSVVGELHKAGFLIEMDDFGSGYSSLNILKDVPVDILKLDMKFFAGEDNLGRGGMIINAVLRMSRWLNIPVIAEGVELKDQADFLLSIGCPTIQGYLYERPMPAASFEKMLLSGTNGRVIPENPISTELDAHSFWDSSSLDSKVFNNYIGAATVFEYHGGEYEIIRMNTRFLEAMKIKNADTYPLHGLNIVEADKPKLKKAVLELIYSGKDVKTEISCNVEGEIKTFGVTLRAIAKSPDRALIFAVLDS